MSEVSTTRVIKCDLCGREWTVTTENESLLGFSNMLPSLSGNMFGASYIGSSPDYCPDCVSAVQVAIDQAKDARRHIGKAVS